MRIENNDFFRVISDARNFIPGQIEQDLPKKERTPSILNPSETAHLTPRQRIDLFRAAYSDPLRAKTDPRTSFSSGRVRSFNRRMPPQHSRVSSEEQPVVDEKMSDFKILGGMVAYEGLQVANQNRKDINLNPEQKDKKTIESIMGILVHRIVYGRHFDRLLASDEEIIDAINNVFLVAKQVIEELSINLKEHLQQMPKQEFETQRREYYALRQGSKFGYPTTDREMGVTTQAEELSPEQKMLHLVNARQTEFTMIPGTYNHVVSYYRNENDQDVTYLLHILNTMDKDNILTGNQRTKQNLITKFREKTLRLQDSDGTQKAPRTRSMFPLILYNE